MKHLLLLSKSALMLTILRLVRHQTSDVVKVCSNVYHLQVGDRVAIEPGVPCKSCDFCKNGTYNCKLGNCPLTTIDSSDYYLTNYYQFFSSLFN